MSDKLAHTPRLPDAARAPLLALANGANQQEAMLAIHALGRLARRIDLSGHPLRAAAENMPLTLPWFENALVPTLVVIDGDKLQDWKRLQEASLAGYRRMDHDSGIAERIDTVRRSGEMGSAARSTVPALIAIMQAAPAQVREAAATSLGLIGSRDALPALLAVARAQPGTTLAQRARLAAKRIAR